ncbi:hypothetical protein [Paraburkholderia adhaesiva]|uniref:hypothetical protein n=1 Tax=Paraburkholderia adhaesiva TaxID=2883244 RepID=UPI001F20400C|nr:hypothetical protein [Paraburkholderia adhaesiva]
MNSTTGCGGNMPTREAGTRHGGTPMRVMVHPLTGDGLGALLARYLREAVEMEQRGRALQCDASGLRPGEVLLAHMTQMAQWNGPA